MANKKLSFRSIILGLLFWVVHAIVVGFAFGLLAVAVQMLTDLVLVRILIFLAGMPVVLYLFPLTTAILKGKKIPSILGFLFAPFTSRSKPNPSFKRDA